MSHVSFLSSGELGLGKTQRCACHGKVVEQLIMRIGFEALQLVHRHRVLQALNYLFENDIFRNSSKNRGIS